MTIKFIQFDFAGQVGVNPRLGRIVCTENLTEVTTAGFLNPASLMGNVIYPTDFIFIAYDDGTSGAMFRPSISATGVITLLLDNASVNLPVTDAHLAQFNGTSGQIEDSGVPASAVQLKANIIAARSATFAGGGTTFNIAVTGLTANSIAVANIHASTNNVRISKVTCSTDQIAITFSADPGAATTVNYVAFIVAQ